MKLIIIHGPPAVGKLAVANEIASSTGFKVFHNHLSIDCDKAGIRFGTKPFGRTGRVHSCRNGCRGRSTKAVDLIYTFLLRGRPRG